MDGFGRPTASLPRGHRGDPVQVVENIMKKASIICFALSLAIAFMTPPACASPKFCRAVKSTACEISSPRSPAITLVHVPLVLSLVRNARSHFSFTPELTPGKFGPPAAPHRAEAQAPQTQAPHARHTFLGGHPPILVWVETISHRRDSGNRGSLA